jgi:hypothetical protein
MIAPIEEFQEQILMFLESQMEPVIQKIQTTVVQSTQAQIYGLFTNFVANVVKVLEANGVSKESLSVAELLTSTSTLPTKSPTVTITPPSPPPLSTKPPQGPITSTTRYQTHGSSKTSPNHNASPRKPNLQHEQVNQSPTVKGDVPEVSPDKVKTTKRTPSPKKMDAGLKGEVAGGGAPPPAGAAPGAGRGGARGGG